MVVKILLYSRFSRPHLITKIKDPDEDLKDWVFRDFFQLEVNKLKIKWKSENEFRLEKSSVHYKIL